MTDRTHPDSGRIITSGDILLHDAETALMYEELRAAIDDGHESMTHADALAEIAAIRAENAELRAQLEAIGAGGVTGPLIARTVVKAADHFPDAGQMVPARWYMVDKIGMATLCSNRADAEQEAKDATLCYPHMAPHRAVLLAPGACELKTTNAEAKGPRSGPA